MFKVEKIEYQNKTFRLPAPLIERLARAAQENGLSMTKLLIQLCEYGLKDLEEPDKK